MRKKVVPVVCFLANNAWFYELRNVVRLPRNNEARQSFPCGATAQDFQPCGIFAESPLAAAVAGMCGYYVEALDRA